MRKPLLVIVSVVLLASGCATSVTGRPVAGPAPAPEAGQCKYGDDNSPGAAKPFGKPGADPDTGVSTIALNTNKGALTIQLDPTQGICSVQSVRFLVAKKFYDGSTCHRLTTNPSLGVLQCGDPTGTGTGTPGYQFDDKLPARGAYQRGVVAMANAGPGTNGSQFFIVHGSAQIDPDYPVVGKVTAGMEIVDQIVAGGVKGGSQDGQPATPLSITTATGK
ncbi:peptidylprolyl isomerase [Umezawaea sp. Da 62-37]|uniref:peptidylprolyl isomerase n=1 Tax=Umezawaea sp. Da 62-37 TaxID=3075927 RepID=UPI0028F6EBD8|nr:peptidylprolyl isomerase [Umezawaea sp. Da 62-37]WNV89248.1 peptidylprolyl isomerase [Umezawaea sp. Da 62-37]